MIDALATKAKRWALDALNPLLGTLLLLGLIAGVIGRPPVFPDTAYYYAQGAFLADALGVGEAVDRESAAGDVSSLIKTPGQRQPRLANTVAAGRSAIYGVPLYVLIRLSSLWGVAAAQSALAAWLLWVTVRAVLGRTSASCYWAVLLAASLGSSLFFYTGFIMPDIFVGLGGLALLLLLLCWRQLGRGDRLALGLLLTFSLAVHAVVLLCAVATTAVAWVAAAWLGRGRRRAPLVSAAGVGVALSAVFLALAAGAGYSAVYAKLAGVRQAEPPFLMARVLADGPGRDRLRHICPDAALDLCRYRNKPMDAEENILWANNPKIAVFDLANYAERTRLEREQIGFVVGAVAAEPISQVAASLRNWVRQLGAWYVGEPLRPLGQFQLSPIWRKTSIARIAPDMAGCTPARDLCAPRIGVDPLSALHAASYMLTACALLLARYRASKIGDIGLSKGDVEARLRAFALGGLVCVYLLVNAGVCAVLVGVFPRYEARVIWLAPLSAVLMWWPLLAQTRKAVTSDTAGMPVSPA